MELTELHQLGLSPGEIRVYEALLNHGESTKTALATHSGVSPANIYDVTNRLAEKGLISIVEKNGVKHFTAANPRHLFDFLAKKKAQIQQEEQVVQQLLPSLQAAFAERQQGLRVETYTGWEGLATIFKDLLEECTPQDMNYVFGASAGERPERADTFFLKYSRMRKRKNIPLRIIFTEEVRKRRDRIEWFLENADVRFLIQHGTTEIMVYKGTTVLLILTTQPLAIRIREPSVAVSFKGQFEQLWKIAKK